MVAKLLLVDDDATLLRFTSEYLEGEGFEIFAANSGVEALRLAYQEHPDLVVLDVMMPGTGGSLMYKQLKTDPDLASIPVIMLSAVGQRSFQHYLKMLKVKTGIPLPDPDAYIEKPPDAKQLLEMATRLIDSQKR